MGHYKPPSLVLDVSSAVVISLQARSATHDSVTIIPMNEMSPHAIITASCPKSDAAVAKNKAPISAPAFPQAAQNPFRVERQGLRNTLRWQKL
jgi:hypothetical protein